MTFEYFKVLFVFYSPKTKSTVTASFDFDFMTFEDIHSYLFKKFLAEVDNDHWTLVLISIIRALSSHINYEDD